MTKRQLRKQNHILANRVLELEEILCPCRSHDLKKLHTTYHYDNMGHGSSKDVTYICTKCKKIVVKLEF